MPETGYTVQEINELLHGKPQEPDITEIAKEHIKEAEGLVERAEKLRPEAFDKEGASDIYDGMLYRIGEMKDAEIDLDIEMFRIRQEAYSIGDGEERNILMDRYLQVEGLARTMRADMVRLDGFCMVLSERLGDRYEEKPALVSLEEVDVLCKKGMCCLVDGIQRTSRDGYNSYQISESLRCDVLPYLFERYIGCLETMNGVMKDPACSEETALLAISQCREEAEELESYISFADAICLQLLEHETEKYIFKARASSDGKLTISKKERKDISDNKELKVWLLGKEKEDTYTLGLSDGDIEKRVKKTERQLAGVQKAKKTENGTRTTTATIGDLISEITQTEDSTKVAISSSAARIKKEQQERFGDITLKAEESLDIGKGEFSMSLDDDASSLNVGLKGVSAEATVAIQTLERLYHMLTVQGSALDLNTSMKIKEAAGPIPSASAGISLLSADAKAGPKEMTIASAGAFHNTSRISASLEDAAIKIGDKIFAKIKDGADVTLKKSDLISSSLGSSASARVGNNTSWVTLSVKDGKLTAVPITQDDMELKTIVNAAKDISAVAKMMKKGDKIEKDPEDRTLERLNAIKEYAGIR